MNFLAWLKEEPNLKITIVSRQKVILHIWHAMSHAQSLLFPCLTSPAHSTHSVPQTLLSFRDAQPDTPRHERLLGRPGDQNTLTGYEPKDLIEVNDTEVTPTLFHEYDVDL